MTQVVTIQELQKLIPEALQLESQNFPDLKTLLVSIINVVEKSGIWEFVQYIQGKPSLFVVRQKPVKSNEKLTSMDTSKVFASTEMPDIQFETSKTGKVKVKVSHKPEEPVLEQKTQEDMQSIKVDTPKLFAETTMPWHT